MKEEKPRQRILSTASRLFYTQGYNRTGINQIISESDVSKDTLYRNFKGKEDVGIHYIKEARLDWFKQFNNHLSKSKDNKSKLIGAFDFLANSMVVNEFRGCRFLNLLTEIESTSEIARQEIVSHKQQLRETFISLFESLEDAQRDKGELRELGNVSYLLFEGAIIESKIFKDVWPILKSKNMVAKLIEV